jgi:putative CocE/NonD family hydrolase
VEDGAAVRYYAMGASEGWRQAATWPPRRESASYFLGAGHVLADRPGPAGRDAYDVDHGVGSGATSRFGRSTVPVHYGDRRDIDGLLLYRSAPLELPLEIAGQALLELYVEADAEDYLLVPYLEDEAPDGTVRVVSDGVLRALFRDTQAPPRGLVVEGAYRACRRADARPVHPRQTERLDVPLFPTCWVFGVDHRLRVSLAGADADNFPRVPTTGDVRLTVHHGGHLPSRLVLPLVPADGEEGR